MEITNGQILSMLVVAAFMEGKLTDAFVDDLRVLDAHVQGFRDKHGLEQPSAGAPDYITNMTAMLPKFKNDVAEARAALLPGDALDMTPFLRRMMEAMGMAGAIPGSDDPEIDISIDGE
jgi:hypothetical protein